MDKDRDTMMSLFGNTSTEPTNWSLLTQESLLKSASSFWRTIIPMVGQLALSWPVTPTAHRHTQTDGPKWGAERGWGGYWKGSSGWKVFISLFIYLFGWVWLTNFLAKENRHWSQQRGSYHQLVKGAGAQARWRDTMQCKQNQVAITDEYLSVMTETEQWRAAIKSSAVFTVCFM